MILLDTHAIVWLVIAPERLSRAAASAIRRAQASDGIAIADVTLFELASALGVSHVDLISPDPEAISETKKLKAASRARKP